MIKRKLLSFSWFLLLLGYRLLCVCGALGSPHALFPLQKMDRFLSPSFSFTSFKGILGLERGPTIKLLRRVSTSGWGFWNTEFYFWGTRKVVFAKPERRYNGAASAWERVTDELLMNLQWLPPDPHRRFAWTVKKQVSFVNGLFWLEIVLTTEGDNWY